jgi:GT2 family glycosyltransferase
LNIAIVRLDRNSGPAVARNTAWRRSSAPVVAFTDDDCMPTPSWLEAGLRTIEQMPCVLVGATEPDPAQRHLLDPLARTMHVTRPTFAPTCNIFYRRSDLEAVGGFDERFRVPVGEDTDLAWRINEHTGLDLRFAPDALVYHDVRVRSFAQAVKETQRWVGIPRVVARHRKLARRAWHARYFLRPSHPRVILAALGLTAGLAFPAAILLTLPWLRHRVFPRAASRTWATNLRYAPAVFAIDALEVWVLAKGSIRHRALIL